MDKCDNLFLFRLKEFATDTESARVLPDPLPAGRFSQLPLVWPRWEDIETCVKTYQESLHQGLVWRRRPGPGRNLQKTYDYMSKFMTELGSMSIDVFGTTHDLEDPDTMIKELDYDLCIAFPWQTSFLTK